MKDKEWPTLPQDPSWVLEQIEMGFRQAGIPLQSPPAAPEVLHDEIESAVTRLLQEELARLDEEAARKDRLKTVTPGVKPGVHGDD
jgi:hypothetical protein